MLRPREGLAYGVGFDEGVPRFTIIILGEILASGDFLFDRVDQLRYGSVWVHHFGLVQLVPFSVGTIATFP